MATTPLRAILEDAPTRREHIRKAAVDGLTSAFPLKAGKWNVELANMRVEPKDYSSREQKQAILEGRSLSERVRGDLTVKNAEGEIVDHAKDFTLLRLPYFTPRHTFILDGTEYSVSNMLRQKPGAYVRRRGNEELEAAFNLSKGANFRISMDPEKGLLHMQPSHTTSKIPLYPVLRALGVPHQDIAAGWSPAVANMNRDAFKTPERHVDKLYETLIHPSKQTAATPEDKARVLREYFENTSMNPEVTKETLGHAFDKASPMAMLAASKKLIDVHKNAADVDDRDSLAFKTFHSVDDFVRERLALETKAMRNKLGWKLDAHHGNIKDALPANPFSKALTSFLTGSSLSAVPTQINPLALLDDASRVTMIGEGGIASERAIPMEARDVHPTHLGILDAVKIPESFKAGVDLRVAIGARRDNDGNLYAPVIDNKTKKLVYLKAADMSRSVVAFPGQNLGSGKMVDAMDRGVVSRVSSDKITHALERTSDMHGPTTNLLPMLNAMQGNRSLMASKHQAQALPLVHREAPWVQVESWVPGKSVEEEMVKLIVPTAEHDGYISKIDGDFIHVSPHAKHAAEEADKLHYVTDFPLASKTYLTNTLKVKEGDHVKKGQTLAESNFTKDGVLALGTNLRVAYMPYRGFNSNDAIVVSQGGADKLTSEQMYHHVLEKTQGMQTSRDKHRAYFGNKYTSKQYDVLDDDGVVKSGTVVKYGDPLMVSVIPTATTGDAAMLGKLSKSLVKPFREVVETWTHEYPGKVIDIAKTGGRHAVTVKTEEHLQIGDKLSNRWGAKGVIGKIVPDHQMPQDEKGRPIDILVTSAGVISRINPGQIVEAALGKVAEHTGKPILMPQFSSHNLVDFARDKLKEHGLTDKETVHDPMTGKDIPKVFVGNANWLRLFKSTETNFSAHGSGKYDFNEQPSHGGPDGAKALGRQEVDGLVAHNARGYLRDAAAIKSQKNDEFWRAVQLGLPTPAIKTPFAYDKLLHMLTGAGIKVDKQGSKLILGPLTDADILKASHGALKDPSKLIRAKDLRPEIGGLFDPATTGGASGTLWSHVNLHEPIVNPVFEEPVRRLLGLTQKEFTDRVGKGGSWFKSALGNINIDKKTEELIAETKRLKGPALDNAVKQLKYLSALKEQGLKPAEAYVLTKIPVTPPVIRPILPLPGGKLQVSDANLLYKDLFLGNDKLQEASKVLPSSELNAHRNHLYDAAAAVFGIGEPVSPGVQRRGAKGYIATIAGARPGSGFFQGRLMKRQQDVSGRATISPDPTLNLDEVGVPVDMLRTMYGKFVIGRLVKRGYSALDAQKMVEDNDPVAHNELMNEIKERPLIVNRAPSLSRQNLIGAYAKPISGKTIGLNPFAESGLGADHDGDVVGLHVPVTDVGVEDVKRITLSNQIFTDRNRTSLNVSPEMEAVMGLHRATQTASSKKITSFETTKDALAAFHRGEIDINDKVHIGK